jgi:hypothetical protein
MGSPVVVTATSRPTRTVSVYLSYCADTTGNAGGGNYRLDLDGDANSTQVASLHLNNTLPDSPSSRSNSTLGSPLCQVCPESVGVCCPPTVSCSTADGKCPLYALENGGNMINGYLIQQVTNSTAPVAGRKKVRALPKGSGDDLVDVVQAVDGLKKHHDKKLARHRHF